MRADLQRLKRDTDSGSPAAVTASSPVSRKKSLRKVAAGLGVVAAIVMALLLWESRRAAVAPVESASVRAIPVLPSKNAGSDKATDFLKFALPDEMALRLTIWHCFSIVPFPPPTKSNGPHLT